MTFFTGEHTGKIDAKGRLVLPARFKAQLPKVNGGSDREDEQGEVVLRMGFEPSLQLYPMDVYKPQHEKIAALSMFNPEQLALRRYFFSRTIFLSLDNLGRLLLPRSFLTYAQLRQAAFFVGVGDFIEIWSPEAYKGKNVDTTHYARLAKRYLDG